MKKYMRDRLKKEDAVYVDIQEEHSKATEQRRQLFFDNLKKYQDANENKRLKLSSFLG